MTQESQYVYAYPRPTVTVDAVLFRNTPKTRELLLIERKHDPFAGAWALPGGFVEIDETLETAVARELAEETGLHGIPLKQFHAFGDPGRDPRGRTISIAFLGEIEGLGEPVRGGDDAKSAQWFPINSLPPLAFDHQRIVEYALERLQDK